MNWEKMLNIDRRWIFLALAIVVVVPFMFRMELPITTTKEVEDIFNFIEELDENNAMFISVDYDPGTMAENQPMTEAVLRHAFARRIPVFMTSYTPLGQALADIALETVTDTREPGNFVRVNWDEWEEYRYEGITRFELEEAWERDNTLPEGTMGWVFEGVDYTILGYAPVFSIVILGMGSSITAQYPEDMYGNPVEEMPMLKAHKSGRDVDLAITMAGSSACVLWITYGRESFGLNVAFGVTAVMATDYYTYLQSGQTIGQMGGLRGAAEYEVLLEENGYAISTGDAFRGMDVQSLAHILIIIFVVLGNIAYFAGGFHRKSKRLESGR